MKLSDLNAVRDLSKVLEYLATLRAALNAPGVRVRIGEMHVRPDLAEFIRPAIDAALDAEVVETKASLAALGVEA